MIKLRMLGPRAGPMTLSTIMSPLKPKMIHLHVFSLLEMVGSLHVRQQFPWVILAAEYSGKKSLDRLHDPKE